MMVLNLTSAFPKSRGGSMTILCCFLKLSEVSYVAFTCDIPHTNPHSLLEKTQKNNAPKCLEEDDSEKV